MLKRHAAEPRLMRYLVQLIIPALIFIGVVWFATRRRAKARDTHDSQEAGGDTAVFITILIIGAIAAVAIAWASQWLWDVP